MTEEKPLTERLNAFRDGLESDASFARETVAGWRRKVTPSEELGRLPSYNIAQGIANAYKRVLENLYEKFPELREKPKDK